MAREVWNDGKEWVVTYPTGLSGDLGLEEALLRNLQRAFKIFATRHRKYGVENIAGAGRAGILTRIGDKLARLRNTNAGFADESEEDAWIDLANYAHIGLLWVEGDWPRHAREAGPTGVCPTCGHEGT